MTGETGVSEFTCILVPAPDVPAPDAGRWHRFHPKWFKVLRRLTPIDIGLRNVTQLFL